jgi:hypothetical protein
MLNFTTRFAGWSGVVFLFGLQLSTSASAVSHSYINTYRSSTQTHVFVSQSVEGEYGTYSQTQSDQSQHENVNSSSWQGYGIRTSVGFEIMKFLQFDAGHTFLNLRKNKDRLENIDGSRLFGEARAVFISPIGNLEAGIGASALRLDYQKQLESSALVGNGFYYSLGINYFLSNRVSIYSKGTFISERMIKNGGTSEFKGFETETTALGAGFRIWL